MSSPFSPAGGMPIQTCQQCNAPLPALGGKCGHCGYQNNALPIHATQQQSQNPPLGNAGAFASGKGPMQQFSAQQEGQAFPSGMQKGAAGMPPMQPPAGAAPNSGMFRTQQGGSGQYPPMPPRPSQPLPTPPQGQMNAGQPFPPGVNQPRFPGPGSPYGPQQAYGNTGNIGRSAGQIASMTGPMSRPMPSMPLPASSAARREQNLPRSPLGTDSGDAPNWSRLLIILMLLIVLAGGGYLGFTRLMMSGSAKPTATKSTLYQPTGTPLFSDDFTSNIFGWNLQADEANFAVTIGGSALTLECNAHKLLWELVPGSRMYSNVQVDFDAELADGDQNNGYGVYIRGTSNASTDLATYYRFELYGDGSYAIFKGSVDAAGDSFDTKLFGYTGDSAINKEGKVNHVVIIANGTKLTFVVNGVVLKSFTDSSYDTGSIALFVSNLPEARAGAQARFAHFAIYPYPNGK